MVSLMAMPSARYLNLQQNLNRATRTMPKSPTPQRAARQHCPTRGFDERAGEPGAIWRLPPSPRAGRRRAQLIENGAKGPAAGPLARGRACPGGRSVACLARRPRGKVRPPSTTTWSRAEALAGRSRARAARSGISEKKVRQALAEAAATSAKLPHRVAKRLARDDFEVARARRVATPCGRFALVATASASAWRTFFSRSLTSSSSTASASGRVSPSTRWSYWRPNFAVSAAREAGDRSPSRARTSASERACTLAALAPFSMSLGAAPAGPRGWR